MFKLLKQQFLTTSSLGCVCCDSENILHCLYHHVTYYHRNVSSLIITLTVIVGGDNNLFALMPRIEISYDSNTIILFLYLVSFFLTLHNKISTRTNVLPLMHFRLKINYPCDENSNKLNSR